MVNKSTTVSLLVWGELVYSPYHGLRCHNTGFLGESLFSVKFFLELPSCNTMGQSKRNIMFLINSYIFACFLKLKGEHYGNLVWMTCWICSLVTEQARLHLVLGTSEKDANLSIIGNHERIKPKRKCPSESQWKELNFSLEVSRLLPLSVIICLVFSALALVVQISNTKYCCKPSCILIVNKGLQ